MFTLTTHLQPLSSGLIEVQNYGFSDFLMSFISPNFIQAMYNLLGILGFLMSAILFITHLSSQKKFLARFFYKMLLILFLLHLLVPFLHFHTLI